MNPRGGLMRTTLPMRWLHVLLAVLVLATPLVAAAQASAPPSRVRRPASSPHQSRGPTRTTPSAARPSPATTRRSGAACANRATRRAITNLPGAEKGVLIQPFVQYPGSRSPPPAKLWRQVRNEWIIPYGGALSDRGAGARARSTGRRADGRPQPDTGPQDRALHALRARHALDHGDRFVVLAVSGLVMAFGKFFLLPLIGATLFGWLTYALKTAHNFAGPVFAVSLVIFHSPSCATTCRAGRPELAAQAAAAMSAASSRLRTASMPARRCCSGSA